MRQIKFRAWSFIRSMMFSTAEMARDQLTMLPTGEFINVADDYVSSTIYTHDMMLPEEFTECYDKNNQEIYEGDIVSGTSPDSERDTPFEHAVVMKEDGVFIIRESGKYIDSVINPAINKCIEVIGNIHEHPALLEVI